MEFEAGKSYCISTEKAVDTIPGAPWPQLIKQSMYAIKTLTETPNEVAWWTATDKPHIVLNKRGAQYILCTLDRDAKIRGTSEFIDPATGDIFAKKEVAKWLPYTGPFGQYICVKLETIRQVDMIRVADEEEPVMDPNGPMAQILKQPF